MPNRSAMHIMANSEEEIITRNYIAGGKADIVCILADASQHERSLYMLADYAGIRVPAILLLNMTDVAEALAFIFATTFNVPCVVALASTHREPHSLSAEYGRENYQMGIVLCRPGRFLG